MINSSIGPSGVVGTGFGKGSAVNKEPPKRLILPNSPRGALTVLFDVDAEIILGEGEGALDVAGVA
jgi:hypothetical protein